MEGVREGRHLAAIMFVDMVGYSARMQENEPRAIAAVRGLWDLVRPILTAHGGREVDLAGDGMLMEFPGALVAVRCAQKIQTLLHEQNKTRPGQDRIRTRAGVHLGDIEHKDGRIYGDGVNIAARVIALAPPGGIALTAHVKDQLVNVLSELPQRLGTKTLKNFKVPLEIWCIPGPDCTQAELSVAKATAQDDTAARKWSFGNATLDERTLELTVDGNPAELEKKSLDVLTFLLHHAGEVVTKDEILEAVWPGRVLTETVLTQCISRIREAIKDEDQSAIKTVHGFGYRLTVPVKVETVAGESAPHFALKEGDKPPLRPLWSLVKRLGIGGHGEAWLAQHDKTREYRVFKFALEASALTSLKREITIFRILKDTQTGRTDFVNVLDWNLEELPYFIECEYSNGGNLAQWIEQQGYSKLSLKQRLDLIAQIAEALAAAHSVGVLHKDLKPSNVLVASSPLPPGEGIKIKLADFGSGGVLDPQRLEQMGITRLGFTKTILKPGATSGTPLYLAPEVIAGQPFTSQSDVYALGVMLYQLIVGDLHKTLAPGWEKDVPDELLREDISASAAGNPSHRLTDAALLAQRLRTLDERKKQREIEKIAHLKAERQQRATERSRVRRWWTAGVTATLGIAAIAGFFLWLDTLWTTTIAMMELDEIATKMEKRGELAEAEIVYRNMLANLEHMTVNPNRGQEIFMRNSLAMLLMKRNKRAEAEEQFTRVLSDTANLIFGRGTEGVYYSVFSSNYGEFLIRSGKYEQARKILETAQRKLITTLGDERCDVDNPCELWVQKNTDRLRQVYRALGLIDEEARLPPAKP